MKILTIMGTRPEIIRLGPVIEKLDRLCEHVVLHTGQNASAGLRDVFFDELGVRAPDISLSLPTRSFGVQVGSLFAQVDDVLARERPDGILILGDTSSGLVALLAKRRAISVYHMEAGNRCYDDRVPEEVNRRMIDHCSDLLMPYTNRSRQNLLREGIDGQRVFVTGNPIFEVLSRHDAAIKASTILRNLDLTPQKYFVVTMHRAENVDVPERIRSLVDALDRVQRDYNVPVVISTHPRTRLRIAESGVASANPELRFLDPFGFFDFVALERNALCVLTDSGTVQEETAMFGVPNVTIRDVTERPETLECGSNILAGSDSEVIQRCVRMALDLRGSWTVPPEYLVPNVSQVVVKTILGVRPWV